MLACNMVVSAPPPLQVSVVGTGLTTAQPGSSLVTQLVVGCLEETGINLGLPLSC